MKTWEELIEHVQTWEESNDAIKSNKKSLIRIFRQAELWGISPSAAIIAAEKSHSRLREIVREANKAIEKKEKERLEIIFSWAADLTVSELRNQLRSEPLEEIPVEWVLTGKEKLYRMELSEQQFSCISKALERKFKFNIKVENLTMAKKTSP